MELFDGVHLIELTYHGRPVQLTLLRGKLRTVLLDAGTVELAAEGVLPAMAGLGMAAGDVDLLLVTHADIDHFGGAAALKAAGAAAVACGEADRPLIESPEVMIARRGDRYGEHGIHMSDAAKAGLRTATGGGVAVDFSFVGGEAIRLSADWAVHVVAVPGHTPGHLALHDPRNGALYAGDAIHGAVYLGRDGQAKLPPTYEQVDDYLATIDRIAGMGLRTYVGCHWPVWRGGQVAAFCAESRRFVLDAEAAVLDAVRGGQARTLRELIALLGPRLGQWPRDRDGALAAAFSGHLARLLRMGELEVEPVDGVNHYRAAGQSAKPA